MRNNFLRTMFVPSATITVVALLYSSPVFASDLGFSYGTYSGLTGTDIRFVIATTIRTVLSLLGIILVVMMLYSGFTWMTSAGNEEKLTTAKKTITRSAIGVAIILSSYALTNFIFTTVYPATIGTP